jgi:hypothetical protein
MDIKSISGLHSICKYRDFNILKNVIEDYKDMLDVAYFLYVCINDTKSCNSLYDYVHKQKFDNDMKKSIEDFAMSMAISSNLEPKKIFTIAAKIAILHNRIHLFNTILIFRQQVYIEPDLLYLLISISGNPNFLMLRLAIRMGAVRYIREKKKLYLK